MHEKTSGENASFVKKHNKQKPGNQQAKRNKQPIEVGLFLLFLSRTNAETKGQDR